MAINDLEKMNNYNPTNYVNNSEPDIDADNLNKTENKLAETVEKANQIIDALKTLISTVQTNSETTVPSSSLAYSMQQEITKNKEDIATANSNLANLINNKGEVNGLSYDAANRVLGIWNGDTVVGRIYDLNTKIGTSIKKIAYEWDNNNPKFVVTDANGAVFYVSLTMRK
jgi:hypothetical protein